MPFTCDGKRFQLRTLSVCSGHRYQINWLRTKQNRWHTVTKHMRSNVVVRMWKSCFQLLSLSPFIQSYYSSSSQSFPIAAVCSHNAIQTDRIMQCLFYHISVSSENHSHWTQKWYCTKHLLAVCVYARSRKFIFHMTHVCSIVAYDCRSVVIIYLFFRQFDSFRNTKVIIVILSCLLTSIKFSKSIQNCCRWALHQHMTRSFR